MTAVVFITRYWRALLGAGLLAAIGALLLVAAHLSNARDAASRRADSAVGALQQTVAGYRMAASVARSLDVANAKRVANEQAAITERVSDAYQDRLSDSDARYQRLRAQAAAYSGRPVAADVSAVREAACRAYAATSCDALPALLKAAQDNTEQLLALIDWTKSQGDVSVGNVPVGATP